MCNGRAGTEAEQHAGQGKVKHEVALALAESEFEKYRIAQDKLLESDFDKAINGIEAPKRKTKNEK